MLYFWNGIFYPLFVPTKLVKLFFCKNNKLDCSLKNTFSCHTALNIKLTVTGWSLKKTQKFSDDKINKFLEGPVVLKLNCYPTKENFSVCEQFY